MVHNVKIAFPCLFLTLFLFQPTILNAQVGDCMICESIPYPDGNWYSSCVGAFEGQEECAQDGGMPVSACHATGPDCVVQMAPDGTTTDGALVFVDPAILGGFTSEIRTGHGSTFFTRACDGAVVRRVYSPEQKKSIRIGTQRIVI